MEPGARADRPTRLMSSFRFVTGDTFDVTTGELQRDGGVARLEPQPAAVLALLASRAGGIVTHDEIKRALWGDHTHVNFRQSVHYCVRQIRVALNDAAPPQGIIETIPRRGYRLRADALLPVGAETDVSPRLARASDASPAVSRRARAGQRSVVLACVAVALASTVFIERRPNNHHQIALSLLKIVHDLVF